MVTTTTGSPTDTGNLDFAPPVEFDDDWDGNEPSCQWWASPCTAQATNSITVRHYMAAQPERTHPHPPQFFCDRHLAVEIARILEVEVPSSGLSFRHLVDSVHAAGRTYHVPPPADCLVGGSAGNNVSRR